MFFHTQRMRRLRCGRWLIKVDKYWISKVGLGNANKNVKLQMKKLMEKSEQNSTLPGTYGSVEVL